MVVELRLTKTQDNLRMKFFLASNIDFNCMSFNLLGLKNLAIGGLKFEN